MQAVPERAATFNLSVGLLPVVVVLIHLLKSIIQVIMQNNSTKSQAATFVTPTGQIFSAVFPMDTSRTGTFDVTPMLELMRDTSPASVAKYLIALTGLANYGAIAKAKAGLLQSDYDDIIHFNELLRDAILKGAGEIDLS